MMVSRPHFCLDEQVGSTTSVLADLTRNTVKGGRTLSGSDDLILELVAKR
jgi:hypothetical protein